VADAARAGVGGAEFAATVIRVAGRADELPGWLSRLLGPLLRP
jgi:hypothetical protein